MKKTLMFAMIPLTVLCAKAEPVDAYPSSVVIRRIAAESFVLLKNDGTLPLKSACAVDLTGSDFIRCGNGSAVINPPYVVDFRQGLTNAGFRIEKDAPIVLWNIARHTTEGRDARNAGFWYALTDKEMKAFAEMKQAGKKIVVLINAGTPVSMAAIQDDPAVAAILYVSFPGMEAGNALADVLTGAVNPSGRLNATMSKTAADHPCDANWQEARHYVPYEDDIFVGYRYFSTIPGAAEKVAYPFGYGLSYTTFKVEKTSSVQPPTSNLDLSFKVTNTGKVAGRESVLVYTGVTGGKAEHPARELRGFAKTRLLNPGESEELTVSFPVESLAYFDDEGTSGHIGSWVIDGGTYAVYAGGDVASAKEVGRFELSERIISTPGFKLDPARLARRLRANGTYDKSPVTYGKADGAWAHGPGWAKRDPDPTNRIMFADVAAGKATVDDFLKQMPIGTLTKLLYGQQDLRPNTNTGSIGYLPEYGVPGVQLADGPVGVRLTKRPSLLLPATALIACSFDTALMEEAGRVLADEMAKYEVDVLLAPGLCLARHPMCGRNFEYMGEDPLLAGKMAAAYVRGVQSKGGGATLKHFAANNRENERHASSSIVSERAMRELYLRGFEIAVKEAQPKCVMTGYHYLNGVATSASYGLLEGILRGEWGFKGLVMTDWVTYSHLWQNIAAGNDVKMPNAGSGSKKKGACDSALDSFLYSARWGRLDHDMIFNSARRVIELNLELAKKPAK